MQKKLSNTSSINKAFFYNPQTLKTLAVNMHLTWVVQHCYNLGDYNTLTKRKLTRKKIRYLNKSMKQCMLDKAS